MGKKIGMVAMICTIIYIIFCIVAITQAPEIPKDVYELMVKDQEAAQERIKEITDNASSLYKAADVATTITGIGGIVLAIVSIVKLTKAKEKGKIVPVLCIILIIVFFFVTAFSSGNMVEAFKAGLEAGMEMKKQH